MMRRQQPKSTIVSNGIGQWPDTTSLKRKIEPTETTKPSSSKRSRRNKQVLWASNLKTFATEEQSRLQEKHDFDPETVWYSREDYLAFMKDRIRMVQVLQIASLGFSANEVFALFDPINDCIRGLEKFQSESTTKEFQSRRQVHVLTILLEQQRQKLQFGKTINPGIFRDMAAMQSSLAQKRAQELALIDEIEVYGIQITPRNIISSASVLSDMNTSIVRNNFEDSSNSTWNSPTNDCAVEANRAVYDYYHDQNNNHALTPLDRLYQAHQMNLSVLDHLHPEIAISGGDNSSHSTSTASSHPLSGFARPGLDYSSLFDASLAASGSTIKAESPPSLETMPFKFPIRRDSLFGNFGNGFGEQPRLS